MPPQKYKLSEPTPEEKDAFMREFQELTNKHSLYFEPIPILQRQDANSKWELACQILLQKKTELVEVERSAVPSLDPEINPTLTPDESTKEN